MTGTQYKPVSALAVITLILGVTGTVAFLVVEFIVVGMLAVPFAIAARRGIKKYTLYGGRSVYIGTTLAVLTLPLASGWHVYLYESEALAGHERLNFTAMIRNGEHSLDEYQNSRICLKGYALATRDTQVRSFLLSPDGDDRQEDRAITVDVPDGWEFDYDAVSVSGTLLVHPNATNPAERYVLQSPTIKRAKTWYELAGRVWRGRGC